MYFCKKRINLKLTIIGNSSASPRPERHPSCQVIEHNKQLFLIDCGEGSQHQLIRFKIKYGQIDHILISHLHGDHFFGLIGLLTTYFLNNRSKDLHIYSHKDLKSIIELQLSATETTLPFSIIYHELPPHETLTLLEDDSLTIRAFPLNHRVSTHGFHFETKTTPSKSFAYCSDTRFDLEIIPHIKNTTLLYHEATFGRDKEEAAFQKFHSTALQAAQMAKLSNTNKLLIGHFSAKYNNPNVLLEEAITLFKNTFIAKEGESYEI